MASSGHRRFGSYDSSCGLDWNSMWGGLQRHEAIVSGGEFNWQIEVDPVSWTPICLSFGVHDVKEASITKKRPPYAPEFRRQMIELVRAGRAGATGEGVRAIGASNPQLGCAGRS